MRLSIHVCGSLHVTLGGEPITDFESSKVRALLAYLALEVDRSHSRDELIGLLWPDQPERAARRNLSQALFNLRQSIHDDEADPPFLCITRETVQFNPKSDYWLDVAAFAGHLAEVERHAHLDNQLCETCSRQFEQADALYRGEFLAGFFVDDSAPFSDWATLWRERLHRQALDVQQRLAEYHEHCRDYERARHYAWRQVELEPWREEAHQQLMRLLARSGQRSAALAQYEKCRRSLVQELGLEPAQKTRALYDRIRSAGEACPHNLPPQVTPLIGRAGELEQIAERLADPDCRLLTLAGLGGIGKTHLALQAAREHVGVFLHGVYFVPLAALSSPEFLIPTIANAIGFNFSGSEDPQSQLLNYLRNKEILLVLDNMEHLIEGTPLLLETLRRAPEIKIMVTSRERLNVRAEWVFDIRELAFPEAHITEGVESYGAVQLFCERARRVGAGFSLSAANRPAVARICQLVEGMPLGIELAAASVAAFSCEQIAAQIARNLDGLATTLRDVPERHRSIRAAFEHSWDLLSAEEQRIFRKLALFRGGFEAKAVRAVAGASERLLPALADKSLVYRTVAGRYEMHGLVKQYAAEKLDGHPQEQSETSDLYCEYYAEFLHQRAAPLVGERQKEALAEITVEIENVRAAWQYAVVHSKEGALEKSLVSLLRFYERRSWFQEGLAVFGRAAASLETSFGPVDQITGRKAIILGLLLSQQGWYSHRLGRSEEAKAFLQKSVAILRRQGVRWELAKVLNEFGVVTYRSGDYGGAKQLYEESVAVCRAIDDRRELSVALSNLGNVCRALGEYEQAKGFLQESVNVFKERGDHYSMAVALNNLGEVFRVLGDHLQARQCYQHCLTVRREIGDRMGIAVSLTNLAGVAQVLGEYEEANRFAQESLTIFLELENRRESAYPLGILGCVARDQGDYAGALAYYGQALKPCMETKHTAKALEVLVDVAGVLAQGKEKKRAAEILTLIAHHPATQDQIRCDAESALAKLETELPPELVSIARKRGQARTLEDVVREIRDE